MALSDIAIRKAKTRDKAYKLYDELGLFLLVSPSGSRLWRMKYKHHGVEKSSASAPIPRLAFATLAIYATTPGNFSQKVKTPRSSVIARNSGRKRLRTLPSPESPTNTAQRGGGTVTGHWLL
jgi:hypothetical protein